MPTTGRDRIVLAGHDRIHGHQLQLHPHEGIAKTLFPEDGLTAGQVLAVVTGLPVTGTLLALSGFTLMSTLIGLAVAVPLFVVFSPVIVPAAAIIGLSLTAVLTSGAFAMTGLWSVSWVANYLREAAPGMTVTEYPVEEAKMKVRDMTSYVMSKAKGLGLVGLFMVVWTVKTVRAAMTGTAEDREDEAEERKDWDTRIYLRGKKKDWGQGIQSTAYSRT